MRAVPRHDIESILETIFKLRKENTSESYISIKNIFKLFSISFPIISVPSGSIFYRVRIHKIDEYNLRFKYIRDVGHILNRNSIKQFGRANEPFQSIFYCADEKETAYFETSKLVRENAMNTSEYYSLSIWETKREFNIAYLPIDNVFSKNHTVELLNNDFKIKTEKYKNNVSKNLQYFLNKIAEEFSKHSSTKDFNYLITCAFSNYIYETQMSLMHSETIDGICYPSVQLKSRGLNFAIKPELIENRDIDLEKVAYNKMQLYFPDKYYNTEEDESKKINYDNWSIEWK